MGLFDQIEQVFYMTYVISGMLSGAVVGSIVVPLLYYRRQRNPLIGVLLGLAAGAVGTLIMIGLLTWIAPRIGFLESLLYEREENNPINAVIMGIISGIISNLPIALIWVGLISKPPGPHAKPDDMRALLLIAETQVLFLVMGLVLMLAGSVRVIIEFESITTFDAQQLKEGLSNWVGDSFTSLPALLIASALMVVGYGLWWSIAALGALETPARQASRLGLLAIILTLMLGVIGVLVVLPGLWFAVIPMIAIAAIAVWFLLLFSISDVRLVLSTNHHTNKHHRSFIWVRNAILVVSASTLAVLGLVYAVLTDAIELPLPDTKPGELLFVTTFDAYNDEWELEVKPNESAQILTNDVDNQQLVMTINPAGEGEESFFSTLNRKFRDFDLRVTTTQLESDEYHDNIIGVIFRYRDDDNFYSFDISGDGYYRLMRREKLTAEEYYDLRRSELERAGQDTTEIEEIDDDHIVLDTTISTWIPTTLVDNQPPHPTLVRPGTGNPIMDDIDAMNEIRIIGRGDRFWFFINNQPVWFCLKGETNQSTWDRTRNTCAEGNVRSYAVEDDTFEQGKIGLLVGNSRTSDDNTPISIAFDNLVITGPPTTITVPDLEESP